MVPRGSPPEEPPRIVGDPTSVHPHHESSQPQSLGKEPIKCKQRLSPNSTAREQQQALQVVRQFFENVPATAGEQELPPKGVSPNLRPEGIAYTMEGPRLAEEATPTQENTMPSEGMPSGFMRVSGSNRPPPTEEQIMEPRSTTGASGNVSVVSPNLVNPITPKSTDLIWPSQFQVRREQLFPKGAIHPKQPN